MIAMHYKITLPSDYPMESIEERIEEKGHLLNGYKGLIYKAYLYSRKDAENYQNDVNSYAPFYIWEDHASMLTFLKSDGFKALCGQFGHPRVEIWFVDGKATKPEAHHSIACLEKSINLDADVNASTYDTWEKLSVTWCKEAKDESHLQGELYAIGYVTHD